MNKYIRVRELIFSLSRDVSLGCLCSNSLTASATTTSRNLIPAPRGCKIVCKCILFFNHGWAGYLTYLGSPTSMKTGPLRVWHLRSLKYFWELRSVYLKPSRLPTICVWILLICCCLLYWEVRILFNIDNNLAHLYSLASLDPCNANKDNSAKNSHSPLDRTEVISLEVLLPSFLSVHSNSLISSIFAGLPLYFKFVDFLSIMVKSLATPVKCRAHKTYDIDKVKQRRVQSVFRNRRVKVKHSQQQAKGNSDFKLRWP